MQVTMSSRAGNYKTRSVWKKMCDFLSFPVRAVSLIEKDKGVFSSLASERFYYVARHVAGYCLDVGCGKHNRFVSEFLKGRGQGIDVYKYDGLTSDQIVEDMSRFPFEDASFESVTFIANINHIPKSLRDIELKEACRCLKEGGNIIVTMGNPIAEILVHKLVWLYDRYLGTNVDMDTERGMDHEEQYYLLDREITRRLEKAGFTNIRKRYFVTQWFLNHLFVAEKQ